MNTTTVNEDVLEQEFNDVVAAAFSYTSDPELVACLAGTMNENHKTIDAFHHFFVRQIPVSKSDAPQIQH